MLNRLLTVAGIAAVTPVDLGAYANTVSTPAHLPVVDNEPKFLFSTPTIDRFERPCGDRSELVCEPAVKQLHPFAEYDQRTDYRRELQVLEKPKGNGISKLDSSRPVIEALLKSGSTRRRLGRRLDVLVLSASMLTKEVELDYGTHRE